MKPMVKILDFIGPVLIIALLSLITAELHYQDSFYRPLLILTFLVLLVVWVGAILLLKIHFVYPRPKGFYWKVIAAWSIVSFISWLTNHFIVLGFMTKSGGRPTLSIPMLIITWILGLILILGWLFGLTLLQLIFTSPRLKWLKVVIEVVLSILFLASAFIVGINIQVRHRFREKITEVEDVQGFGTAVVFGAGVYQESERPSLVLRDRIDTAARLFEMGKAESVILSGDGSGGSIEVDVMARYAMEIGIPEGAIRLDKGGYRTYETCSRAYTEFGIRDALLVTQKFHLPRALLICDSVGLEAVGVRADRSNYSLLSHLTWALREGLATAYAWLEITIFK